MSRLRSEVLDEVWQYFADEEAIHGMRHHLFDIFEKYAVSSCYSAELS